jgi:hypothetical protein
MPVLAATLIYTSLAAPTTNHSQQIKNRISPVACCRHCMQADACAGSITDERHPLAP